MVPDAAACDRVRHGSAVPLGRHLLTPPPQRWRPRVPGARWGTPLPEPLPEPRLSAPLPVLPARGADLRVAQPRQPEPRGSSHSPRPPPPLQLPGASTPPSQGPSHLAGSKGPHSGGGRAQPRANSRSLNVRMNHSYRGQAKGGERMGDAHRHIKYAGRRSSVAAEWERERRFQ